MSENSPHDDMPVATYDFFSGLKNQASVKITERDLRNSSGAAVVTCRDVRALLLRGPGHSHCQSRGTTYLGEGGEVKATKRVKRGQNRPVAQLNRAEGALLLPNSVTAICRQ